MVMNQPLTSPKKIVALKKNRTKHQPTPPKLNSSPLKGGDAWKTWDAGFLLGNLVTTFRGKTAL